MTLNKGAMALSAGVVLCVLLVGCLLHREFRRQDTAARELSRLQDSVHVLHLQDSVLQLRIAQYQIQETINRLRYEQAIATIDRMSKPELRRAVADLGHHLLADTTGAAGLETR